jgi:hypothetical protein
LQIQALRTSLANDPFVVSGQALGAADPASDFELRHCTGARRFVKKRDPNVSKGDLNPIDKSTIDRCLSSFFGTDKLTIH